MQRHSQRGTLAAGPMGPFRGARSQRRVLLYIPLGELSPSLSPMPGHATELMESPPSPSVSCFFAGMVGAFAIGAGLGIGLNAGLAGAVETPCGVSGAVAAGAADFVAFAGAAFFVSCLADC